MTMPFAVADTDPVQALPRQLGEDVLQSAEEAVLSNPASVEGVHPQMQTLELEAAVGGNALASHYQDAVARYVAQNPCQSALIATAAGALAAALLRSMVRRRRR
jgi:ElaB/YqjD/DUF883 family membrane-anchored ribosome-binding protein